MKILIILSIVSIASFIGGYVFNESYNQLKHPDPIIHFGENIIHIKQGDTISLHHDGDTLNVYLSNKDGITVH